MAFVPLIGYAPDLDPTTPGVMTNCSAILPTMKGFKGAPSPASQGISALTARCYGAVAVAQNDETTRIFAGTTNKLFELSSTSWTSRTPDAAGSTLNGIATTDTWSFAQFGDVTLATAKTEIPHFLSSATVFAAVTTTAPKCGIIEVANNFVLAFDVNDQGGLYDSLDRPNGWWAAAKGGYTDWVPSTTTEAATGTLHSTQGKITAARVFGYQCVAYKLHSAYLGTYVGGTQIWDWQLLPGTAGCLSKNAVVNVGTREFPRHLFMGWDNFYEFTGGQAVPIGDGLKDTVFSELDFNYYYAAKAQHDPSLGIVRFYYPVTGQTTPDKCVVYNYRSNKWGRDDRSIEAAVDYIAPGITWDSLGTSYATWDALPNQTWDSAFAAVGKLQPAIFDTSHTLKTLDGTPGASSITTGDYGDDENFFTLTGVLPRFLTAPSSASFVNFYRENSLGDTLTQDFTSALSNFGRFDFQRDAAWHRGRFDMTGEHEISGFTPQGAKSGRK